MGGIVGGGGRLSNSQNDPKMGPGLLRGSESSLLDLFKHLNVFLSTVRPHTLKAKSV